MQNPNDTIIKTQEDFFINICTSHFIVRVRKGYSRFYGERELETERNCNILPPTLMAVGVVPFSFSRAAQPEAQRPTLLGDGFLYCILSATSLDPNSSGFPRAPSAGVAFVQFTGHSFSVHQSMSVPWEFFFLPRPFSSWNGIFGRVEGQNTTNQTLAQKFKQNFFRSYKKINL